MTPELFAAYASLMRDHGVKLLRFGDVSISLADASAPVNTLVVPHDYPMAPTPPAREPTDEEILLGYFEGRTDVKE